MKCYTIQFKDDTYVENKPHPIADSYWASPKINVVTDADDAKHYKNKSGATGWLRNNVKRYTKRVEERVAYWEKEKNSKWSSTSAKRRMETTKVVLELLEGAKVVEVDVEEPTFAKKFILRWDEWYSKCSRMVIRKVTTSKYTCKCCGIKMKNIPYYELVQGNPTKICIPCLYLRVDNIKQAFESMDEDFRNEIINELIIRNM